MDFISHALIGWIICLLSGANSNESFWIIFFSVIPDIVLIPVYIIMGRENKRFLWIAKNGDWTESNLKHPVWAAIYDATHSLFFALLVIYPFVLFSNLPILGLIAYLIHIAVDIFGHKEKWAIKIFYPLKFKIKGFSNAWAWPVWALAISWGILLAIIIFLQKSI